MSAENDQKVTLTFPGGTAEFPILPAVDGDSAIDFSKLNATTGLNAYDMGFVNTANTKSAITFIDGEQGILLYRG
ncbi:MAG: citrate (Si)-synthase, partial [Micrococcales bacterium]|nr:citrate (Si)-synthase [Micrococcales bacterium]